MPKIRPDLPLSSSNESGFFFCGMILDPVLPPTLSDPVRYKAHVNIPICIAQRDESKLGGGVHDQIFCQSAHVCHGQARPHQKLDDKVAVPDAPHAVLGQGREPEFACEEFAIHGKGVAGKGTAAEWENRYARNKLSETFQVIFERKRM